MMDRCTADGLVFSTPSSVFAATGSVGVAIMLWIIGGVLTFCGLSVFLEFGLAIPRSGGVKNYLERSFNPTLMQSCIYIFYCVFLRTWAVPTKDTPSIVPNIS